MNATNVEIAKSSGCSEGAVRKAVKRGTVLTESLDSVVAFVVMQKVKTGWINATKDFMAIQNNPVFMIDEQKN